jgi:hypothetical protein
MRMETTSAFAGVFLPGRRLVSAQIHRIAWSAFAVWLALVVIATVAGPVPAAADPATVFKRGVGVHNMMNWAEIAPGPEKKFVYPPFNGRDYEVTDLEMANLKAAGFDFVRLTLDPGPFYQFEGEQRDGLDAILVRNIRRFLDHGLNVIADFHPISQHKSYLPEMIVKDINAPLFQGYVAIIRRTARLLGKEFPRGVALELMNEPQIGWDPSAAREWQAMEERLYRAAREESPNLPIVVTGGRSSSFKGLVALDPRPFRSPSTIYTFHYYEPHEFTHEGVDDFPMHFLNHMPYPSSRRSLADTWAFVHDRIDKSSIDATRKVAATAGARKLVEAYFAQGFGRKDIEASFDGVAKWAKRNGIDPGQILLGEFGVTRTYGPYIGAADDDRQRWLHDVRSAAEARGFGWAIWAHKGYGGMAIVTNDTSAEIDPVTLDALGLNRSKPPN